MQSDSVCNFTYTSYLLLVCMYVFFPVRY